MLNFKRLCSVVLIVMLILSSCSIVFASAQTTTGVDVLSSEGFASTDDELKFATDDEVATEDEPEIIPEATDDEVDTVPDATDDEIGTATGDEIDGDLPSAVDNSQSPYFPPICGSTVCCDDKVIDSAVFATVYYQFTYEMNKVRGVESTYENSFSPVFVYYIINQNIENGSALEDTYHFLKTMGCATNTTYRYNEALCDDYKLWPNKEEAWREAIKYRMDSSNDLKEIGDEDTQITSADDEDLAEIKRNLVNGKLITFKTSPYSWNWMNRIQTHEDAPENYKFEDEVIAYETLDWDYLELFTWTLVGYNDDIWCDINCNDAVDPGEMGAFKAVNTWGNKFNHRYNDGFCWIAYDALNATSSVEGARNDPDRTKSISSMKTINVKTPDESKGIYVAFDLSGITLSTTTVSFTAEKDGVKYEGSFLPGVKYRLDNDDKIRYYNVINGAVIYSLKDLVPGLNGENFHEYNFEMTFSNCQSERRRFYVYKVELVNEYDGTRCDQLGYREELGSKLEGEVKAGCEYTVKFCDNTTIYYLGYDNPVLYYRTDDGGFKETDMIRTMAKKGYYYKYFLRDVSEAEIYFTDGNGKIDDNNGEYYTATTGYNYYVTEGQRKPLKVLEFGLANGLPDMWIWDDNENDCRLHKESKCYLYTEGGYGPYWYTVTRENLTTGESTVIRGGKEYTDEINLDSASIDSWIQEGTYKITVEVTDWTGAVATKGFEVEVEDHPYEISSITMDKEIHYLSEPIDFTIDANYLNIKSKNYSADDVVPKFDVAIRDGDGNIVWRDRYLECDEYSSSDMTSTSSITYRPKKSGEYTMTVSSTDVYGEHAEKTINFVVLDRIFGDADDDGAVNINDATIIQKYIAGLASADEINMELADCDGDKEITVKDATSIQKYIAEIDGYDNAGKAIEYIPEKYTVMFTNNLGWDEVYCELISPYPALKSGWPGVLMTECGTNEQGETVYTIEVPEGVTLISFNNGFVETLRTEFDNRDTHYCPVDNGAESFFELVEK